MPIYLYREWQAYAALKPTEFSASVRQSQSNWSAGMVAAMATNSLTAVFTKRGTRYQPGDLMLRYKPHQQRVQKTPGELYQLFKAAVLLHSPGNTKEV